VTTCKFVGDASLNNDSFTHCASVCDFLTFANINNGANLQLSLDTQKQKGIQLQGDVAPLTPHWGLCTQTPVIGSRSALAMKFELCAVLN